MLLQTADRFNASAALEELVNGDEASAEELRANLKAACERIVHLEMIVDDMMEVIAND